MRKLIPLITPLIKLLRPLLTTNSKAPVNLVPNQSTTTAIFSPNHAIALETIFKIGSNDFIAFLIASIALSLSEIAFLSAINTVTSAAITAPIGFAMRAFIAPPNLPKASCACLTPGTIVSKPSAISAKPSVNAVA